MDIVKYYTDYIEEVQKKFPSLSHQEIKQILNYGFKMLNVCHRNGMDTLHKAPYFTAYIGSLFNNNLKYYHYWRIKYKKKLRYLYKRYNTIFDGKYYFGLTEKEFEYYNSQKKKKGARRQMFHFLYIYAYKIKEEAFIDRGRKYFFVIDYPEDLGWAFYKENWTTRRAKYFAYRDDDNNIIYV